MKAFHSPFLMAPMAGVTDLAFRHRLRRNGASALWTEMVSAAALVRNHKHSLAMIVPPDLDDSLAVQLFGAKPGEMSEAAKLCADKGVRRLDINMGCPVKKVVKTGAGAALMRSPALAARIITGVRAAFPGILTVKMRTGWTDGEANFLEMGRIAEAEGVDGVIIHGRSKAQGYSGYADWEKMALLAGELRIPVAGNGDVASGLEALKKLSGHNFKAVMIGRAALGCPWIFRDAQRALEGLPQLPDPSPAEIAEDLRLQLSALAKDKGERAAVGEMKKFIAWADKGREGSAERRNRIMKSSTLPGLAAEIDAFAALPLLKS